MIPTTFTPAALFPMVYVSAPVQFPLDLSQWLGKWRLVALALEATQEVGWPENNRRFSFNQGQSFPPQMLLTLLTYSYGIGLYSSRAIAESKNPVVRYLWAKTEPDWATLARFRRLYRAEVEKALRLLLGKSWATRTTNPTPPAIDTYLGWSMSRWALTDPMPPLEEEIKTRIEQAILQDRAMED